MKTLEGGDSFGSQQVISPTTGRFMQATLADLDNDMDLDLIIGRGYSVNYNIAVLENLDGFDNFGSEQFFHSQHGKARTIEVIDLNNDDMSDLIITTRHDTHDTNIGQLLVYKARGTFSFQTPSNSFDNPIEIIGAAIISGLNLNIKDINNDGLSDLLFGNGVVGNTSGIIYSNYYWQTFDEIQNRFKYPRLLNIGHFPKFHSTLMDFDGDGDEDLLAPIVVNFNYRVALFEKQNNEDNFAIPAFLWTDNFNVWAVNGGDINSDGYNDVVFCSKANQSSTPMGVFWKKNLANSGDFENWELINSVNEEYLYCFPTDIDSDGDIDVIASGCCSNIDWYENLDGQGNFSMKQILIENDDIDKDQVFFEDIDGDGYKDIIIRDGSNFLWYIYQNGTFILENTIEHLGGIGGSGFIKLIDYDFDADLDIIVYSFSFSSSAALSIYLNDGDGNFFPPFTIPDDFSAYYPIDFGDVDGDQDIDIIGFDFDLRKLYFFENISDFSNIEAHVYFDSNQNGEKDMGELPLNLQTIFIDPTELTSITNNGISSFIVDPGSYDLSCVPPYGFGLTSQQMVSLDVTDTINAEVYFGMYPTVDIIDGTLSITSAPTRCGFEVPFWISFQNTGTLISDGIVQAELDSLVSFVNSNPAPDSIVGNLIYWSFSELFPTHFGQIELILNIANANFIGEFLSVSSMMDLTNTNASLVSNHNYTYESQINCSYDPNDKMVEPNIPGFQNYTVFGDTLRYTIRFQNTGTDTAFTVRIEDFLDPKLKWNEIKILGASHSFTNTLELQTGRLEFLFENILLPDSSTNEPASHGYITFKIPHKEGLAEHTTISNSANIFFDFNPPIRTNVVQNIMVNTPPLLIEVIHPQCNEGSTGQIKIIYDHPFYESYYWSNGQSGLIAENLPAGNHQLTITTIDGIQIDTTIILHDPSPNCSRTNYSSGLLFWI